MYRKNTIWKKLWQLLTLFFSLVLYQSHGMCAEVLIETNNGVGISGSSIPESSSETWTHTLTADTLSRATRVEAIVGAEDVDYPDCSVSCPACTPAQCENDELWVNGKKIARLSGVNNAPVSNPVPISLADLQVGVNSFELRNIEVNGPVNWVVRVRSSVLSFYENIQETPTPEPQPILLLDIKKYQYKNTLLPGEEQGYRIVVTNNGDTTLTNILITDTLDSLLTFKENKTRYRLQRQNDSLKWSIGTLGPGAKAEVRFNATVVDDVPSSRGISNVAQATASELSAPVDSNIVTAVTSYVPVDPDDLRVTKKVTRRQSRIGRILGYRVRVDNVSNGAIFNLKLEDYLPQGMSLVAGSVLLDGQPFNEPRGKRRLNWNLGTLLGGDSVEIRYQVIIGTNVKRGRNVNRATATGTDGGGFTVSGEDKETVVIGGGQIEVPGEIQVLVFLDENKDGLRNSSDKPLEGIDLILSNSMRKLTNKVGKAVFENLLSGYYGLAIHPKSLPEHTSILGDQTNLVRLMEGERLRLSLPVVQDIGPARLEGIVFYDENKNDTFDDGEILVDRATVIIDEQLRVRTNNGKFLFANLKSGGHKLLVTINKKRITRNLELEIGNNRIEIGVPKPKLTISVEKNK